MSSQNDYKNLIEKLSEIESILQYSFHSKDLLFQSFTHRSFLNEYKEQKLISNERLEFLGDSALNMFVAKLLYVHLPDLDEGALSKRKAKLVSEKSCFAMIEKLDLSRFLLLGRGEKQLEAHKKPSLSADLLEAILGAILLDGGWDKVSFFLRTHFASYFLEDIEKTPLHAKAELQEYLAKKGFNPPEYRVVEEIGPAHEPFFVIGVFLEDKELGKASGKSKKEASEKAAQQALVFLETNP
jgi:ribonuclease III